MIIKTALSNILNRKLGALLNIILVAAGVGIISMLWLLQKQFEEKFEKNISGIDMVLGASGSPLQLVLSSVYHMDAPTGNIKVEEAEKWMKSPLIKTAIPLAYGDSYKGIPIVGTTDDFLEHFEVEFKEGAKFIHDFDVVVGYEIAQKHSIRIGHHFHGTHGSHEEGELHDHVHYNVVGILKKTGRTIDNLLITNVNSVWHIHEKEDEADEKEYTAVWLKSKTPMARFQLPALVKQNSPGLQIAIPAIEINRLISLLGIGINTLKYLAYLIICISAISIFISLLHGLKERKYELAITRVLGATPLDLTLLVVAESLTYCLLGYLAGQVLGVIGFSFIGTLAEDQYKLHLGMALPNFMQIVVTLGLVIAIGIVAAIVPAIKAFSIDIHKTLSDN
jgi:putative ABC transport system permease protein